MIAVTATGFPPFRCWRHVQRQNRHGTETPVEGESEGSMHKPGVQTPMVEADGFCDDCLF